MLKASIASYVIVKSVWSVLWRSWAQQRTGMKVTLIHHHQFQVDVSIWENSQALYPINSQITRRPLISFKCKGVLSRFPEACVPRRKVTQVCEQTKAVRGLVNPYFGFLCWMNYWKIIFLMCCSLTCYKKTYKAQNKVKAEILRDKVGLAPKLA